MNISDLAMTIGAGVAVFVIVEIIKNKRMMPNSETPSVRDLPVLDLDAHNLQRNNAYINVSSFGSL